MPVIKTLVVPADDEQDMYVLEMEQGDTDKMREIVGGWYGASEGKSMPITFWYHDEGKILGLDQNDRATTLWWASDQRFLFFDYLAGDVLITGMADQDGKTEGCPDDFLEIVVKTAGCGFTVKVGDRGLTSGFRGSYFDALAMAMALASNNGAVTGIEIFADS